MNFNVTAHINPIDFVHENSRDSIAGFIVELDAVIAELDFTTDLVVSLVESAKGDMEPSDSVELIQKLKTILGVD